MQAILSDFIDAMTYERGLARLTCDAYRHDLEALLASLNDCTSWKDVTCDHLVRHLSDCRARGFSDRSLMRYAATYKTFFNWLLETDQISVSPTDAFVAQKAPKRLPRTLEEGALNACIEAVEGNDALTLRDRAILEVLYGCGLRCSELIGLNIHDLDPANNTLRVHGKGSKERVVPFGDAARTALGRYLAWRKQWLERYKKGALMVLLTHPQAPLFLSPTGKRLTRKILSTVIRQRVRAQLPVGTHATPHTLRHAFATHLLNHGAPLLDIRDLLGHATIATTQIYTHVSDNRLRDTFQNCFPRS